MAAVGAFFRRQGIRFTEYCKQVATDYATVSRDTLVDIKERPVRAAAVGSIIGGLIYAAWTNPSELELRNELAERRQRMVLTPNATHKPEADEALRERTRLLNMEALTHYDLFFFSLLVKADHDTRARTYYTQDKNLRDWPWVELRRNLVDVGFLGRWFWLENSFHDYDINTDEFRSEEKA